MNLLEKSNKILKPLCQCKSYVLCFRCLVQLRNTDIYLLFKDKYSAELCGKISTVYEKGKRKLSATCYIRHFVDVPSFGDLTFDKTDTAAVWQKNVA